MVRNSGTDIVVGGTGRVGRMLARAWGDRGPAFQSRRPGVALEWDPVAGPEAFLDWCDTIGGCRTMILLAGVTAAKDADLGQNAVVAEACLEAARKAGVVRVLYASSSAVYGRGAGRPFREVDPTAPVNAYGAAKCEAEMLCDRARDAGLEVTALRIGNVAGADQLLINASRAAPTQPLRLDRFPDGAGPRRCYIGAGCLARVLDRLREAEALPHILNVGAPQPVEMAALLGAVGTPWIWVPAPETAVQDLVLDCSALSEFVTFSPDDSQPGTIVDEWRRFGSAA